MRICLVLLTIMTHQTCSKSIVKFNHSNIRILQFADLHMGEDNDKDSITLQLMQSILSLEHPDFVVFSGDQVAGYDVFYNDRRVLLWEKALGVVAGLHIPFATIFGNHDDQPYHMDMMMWNGFAYYALFAVFVIYSGAVLMPCMKRKVVCRLSVLISLTLAFISLAVTNPSHSTRRAILDHEHRAFPNFSYTGCDSVGLHGVSNYRVILQTPASSVALYFIDSGGGLIPDGISLDQLEWLKRLDTATPAIAFVHIPPVQFGSLFSRHSQCFGDAPREASSKCPGSENLLETLASVGTRAVFVGHDHGNSWCCYVDSMLLCYGKHSGFGGYDFDDNVRGVRVIDLHLVNNASFMSISTRISLWDARSGS